MITQLDAKGKKIEELEICFPSFISFFWILDFKYINKHIIYSNIYQELLLKQQMQKLKVTFANKIENEILLVISDVNLMKKSFKNTSSVIRTMPGYQVNRLFHVKYIMKDLMSGLNSAIDIIQQGVVLERCHVPVYYLFGAYRYDRKDRSYQRFLKSMPTENYDNPLLFATVEQNRPITIISPASLERQPVSNFVDKTII